MFFIIVGCGRIGSILAKELVIQNHHVSVIDRDAEHIASLGSGFNGFITKGIEFDHDNLVEAGIDKADVVLAMTDDDNVNITVCLVATSIFHVKRVIAQVVDPNRRYIYEAMKIETVSPIAMGINSLLGKLGLAPFAKIARLNGGIEIGRLCLRRTTPLSLAAIQSAVSVSVAAVETHGLASIPTTDLILNPGDIIICAFRDVDKARLTSILEEDEKS